MSDGNAPPGWYLAPGGRRRWWDGQAWHDQKTAPAVVQQPAAAPAATQQAGVNQQGGVSGIAIAGMILGIIGIVLAVNAYTKPILFLGIADVFGPIALGGVAVLMAAVSGRRGGGFRLAGLICGGFSFAAGLLFIYAIGNR